VRYTDEDIASIRFDEKGLVAAIVQDRSTRDVLMLGWMDAEALRRTLESGRTWFWSRSRQEYWCKGETSGDRQWVRSAAYDCDATRCSSPSTRKVAELVTPATGAASQSVRQLAAVTGTGPEVCSSPGPILSAEHGAVEASPDFASFCELGRDYSVVPVWRELVADTLTPIGAFRAMVGDGPASCSSRSSTASAGAVSPSSGDRPRPRWWRRGRRVEVTEGSLPGSVPLDSGVLACIESLLERFRSPSIAGCHHFTGAWSVISATTWSVRSNGSGLHRPTTSVIPTLSSL